MANGHGGQREGAGRKSTKHEYVDDGELSPLQFMLDIMRDTNRKTADRFDAAKAALPFCSARLQNVVAEVDTSLEIHLVSYLDANSDT